MELSRFIFGVLVNEVGSGGVPGPDALRWSIASSMCKAEHKISQCPILQMATLRLRAVLKVT